MEDLSARLESLAGSGFEDDVRVLTEVVDAPPLETSLVDGYMESRPEYFSDPGWRAAGLGLGQVGADATGVGTAMVISAVLQAALHGRGTASATWAALVRLVVCLPVFLLLLGPSRHRLRLRLQTTLAQQLHEVALPLAGATLACITAWRVVSGLTATARPPEDGLLLTCMLALGTVAVLRTGRHRPARSQHGRRRRVLVVGSGMVADRVAARLEASGRVTVVGFVDDDPKDPTGCVGSLDDLSEACERHAVQHVVVAFSRAPAEAMVDALRSVQGRMPISVVPRLFDVLPSTAATHDLASGYPALSVGPAALGWWPRVVKRSIDVVGATVGLVVALPLYAVAALGVRLTSSGPVLLRQRRVGLNGAEFTVWKFRTFSVTESVPPPEVLASGEMVTGPFPKLKDDPRTTAFGRVLRRLSIDELPQLLNVLLGTMSLVGPRPLQPEFAWTFGTWALRRYAVKPGLTGLWQVSGRNDLTYEEMCRLDHLYVTCWSVGLDMRILGRTARAVLGGRGCY